MNEENLNFNEQNNNQYNTQNNNPNNIINNEANYNNYQNRFLTLILFLYHF